MENGETVPAIQGNSTTPFPAGKHLHAFVFALQGKPGCDGTAPDGYGGSFRVKSTCVEEDRSG